MSGWQRCRPLLGNHQIAHALSEIKAAEDERLAAEGYRFYAQEANEFADASASAMAEAQLDTYCSH